MRLRERRKGIALGIWIFMAMTSLLCATLLAGCGMEAEQKKFSRSDVAMGTITSVTVYQAKGSTEEAAKELLDGVTEVVRNLEEKYVSRRLETAEVWKLNHEAGQGVARRVSPLLTEILERCQRLTEDSEGAFDISIGALTALWKMDEKAAGEVDAALPSEEEIRNALAHCGMERIHAVQGGIWLEEGTEIELGAVGKGVALDEIRTWLEGKKGDLPISAGIFSMGGSIMTYGEKTDGSPWRVAVTSPFTSGESLGTIEIPGGYCVSTSGDYERFFELDGKRYHHVLDPATGYPSENGTRSVTILSEGGFLSDALSTACFVLGREKGMELAKKYDAEILMVFDDGEILMSDGMKSLFIRQK